MKPWILLLLSPAVMSFSADSDPPYEFLIDFQTRGTGIEWVSVNDGVMGGLSQGGATIEKGRLRFSGKLSLENNGGFSSIRSAPHAFDLGDFTGIVVRVKGDGRTYSLRVMTDARYRASPISYRGYFESRDSQWTKIKIPFDAMEPTFRGRVLDGPPLDPAQIKSIGFLIADKKAGPFQLEVDWIAAYR